MNFGILKECIEILWALIAEFFGALLTLCPRQVPHHLTPLPAPMFDPYPDAPGEGRENSFYLVLRFCTKSALRRYGISMYTAALITIGRK